MVEGRDGVLPEQIVLELLLDAQVAFPRPHVAVGQLVPGLGEGLGEGVEVTEEFLADLAILGVDLQRDVRRHHHERVHLAGHVGVRGLGRVGVGRGPLQGAGRAFGLDPVELEEVFQVFVIPAGRVRGPAALDAVGHGVFGEAGALGVLPAEAHGFDGGDLGGRPHLIGLHHAVAFAEGVAAGDEGDGFLVVHGHA